MLAAPGPCMRSILLVSMVLFVGVATAVTGCGESDPTSTSAAAPDGGSPEQARDPGSAVPGDSDVSADAGTASDSAPAASADASASDAASDAATVFIGDGGACNTIAQQAPNDVKLLTSASTAPAPAGGTIVDGTYVLTAATQYDPGGMDGVWIGSFNKMTREIAGTVIQLIQTTPTVPVQTKNGTQTMAVNGLDMTVTPTCQFPVVAAKYALPETFRFTATATGLTLYATRAKAGGGTVVVELVHTKL